jgi:hypothetical protein
MNLERARKELELKKVKVIRYSKNRGKYRDTKTKSKTIKRRAGSVI